MTPEERDRYSRQIRFGGIAEEGQERLIAATAAVVGCGALGSFHAGALARAGVGNLILIDRDFVETSNLQRQWLYTEQDARDAVPKAAAAARAIAEINSGIRVTAAVADLTPANVADLLGSADVVLDGTDNFDTRYLVNDFCVREGIPWIYGAAVGSYGLSMPVIPGRTACLKCVFPEAPGGVQPTCETAGVVNALTSAVASIQVSDALKLLCGHEVKPRISTLDVWSGDIRQVAQPEPDPACVACGRRDFIHLQASSRAPFGLCGRNAVQVHEREQAIDLQELAGRLAPLGDVRAGDFALRFAIPPYELTVFPDGRAIVKGTSDIGLARSLYARYVGA
jgi:adenylyltransferase/sulfurtransferase